MSTPELLTYTFARTDYLCAIAHLADCWTPRGFRWPKWCDTSEQLAKHSCGYPVRRRR